MTATDNLQQVIGSFLEGNVDIESPNRHGGSFLGLGGQVTLRSCDGSGPYSRIVNGTARMIDGRFMGDVRQMEPGRCYAFNATDYSLSTIAEPTYPFSLACWFRVDNTTAGNEGIMAVGDASVSTVYQAIVRDGATLELHRSDAGGTVIEAPLAAGTVVTATWHHILYAFTSSTVCKCYFDGVLVDTVTQTATVLTGVDSLVAGTYRANTPGLYLEGHGIDFRYFGYEVVLADVVRMSKMFPGIRDSGPTDALVHLKGEEGSGTTAYNSGSVGSSADGTITAAAITAFHDATTNDQWSWQNEVGHGGRGTWYDGSDDHYQRATRITTTALGSLSVSAWIRTSSINGVIAAEYLGTGNQRSWLFWVSSLGKLQVDLSEDGGTVNKKLYTTNAAVHDGEYHHVGFTWDSGTLSLYIDGDEAAVTKALDVSFTTLFDSTADFEIGSLNGAGTFFSGVLRGVAFEAAVWTLAQFKTMFAAGVTGDSPPAGAWNFRDGNGIDQNDLILPLTAGSSPQPHVFARNESNKNQDTFANVIAIAGRCPHDAILSSPCLTFDGTADVLTLGNTAISITTVELLVKQLVDDQQLLALQDSTATAVTVVAGVLTFGGSLTVSTIEIDGVTTTAALAGVLLNDNAWHSLKLTMTAITGSDVVVGTDGTAFGNISVADFKLNSTVADLPCADGAGEFAYDVSGNQHHGTLTGTESVLWANQQDQTDTILGDGSTIATRFLSGTSEKYASTAMGNNLQSQQKISMAAWMFSSASELISLGAVGADTSNDVFMTRKTDGTVVVNIGAGTNAFIVTDAATDDDTWDHWLFVFDGSLTGNANRLKLYKNGSRYTAVTYGSTIPSQTTAALNDFQLGMEGATTADGLLSAVVVELAAWSDATANAIFDGVIPSTAWYWRDADENEINQGFADLTATGTPDRIIVPAGIMPVFVGPGILQPGSSIDLNGGQANSPYALQLIVEGLANTVYDQGDDEESASLFARVLANGDGDDRIITAIPSLTGSDLTNMQAHTDV